MPYHAAMEHVLFPRMRPNVDNLKDSSGTMKLVAPWECTREWALIDSPKADSQSESETKPEGNEKHYIS